MYRGNRASFKCGDAADRCRQAAIVLSPSSAGHDKSDKDMAIRFERTTREMANECAWELCIELLLLPMGVSLMSPHALLRILDTYVAA